MSGDVGLGAGIVGRVRPRLGTVRRIAGRRSIGVVARTCVGFGRAIGLASLTRPAVRRDALTTAVVRPPVGYWRWDDVDGDAAPSWTETLAGGGRPAAKTPHSAPAPAEFVASGERRRDALRRMLRADNGERPDVDGGSTSVPEHPSVVVEPVERRRGTTGAGPSTGPGRLGRRIQPEEAETDASIDVLLPNASAPVTRDRRTVSTRRDRSPRALRRMLETSGVIDPTHDGTRGEADPPASGASDGSAPSGSPSDELEVEAAPTGRRTPKSPTGFAPSPPEETGTATTTAHEIGSGESGRPSTSSTDRTIREGGREARAVPGPGDAGSSRPTGSDTGPAGTTSVRPSDSADVMAPAPSPVRPPTDGGATASTGDVVAQRVRDASPVGALADDSLDPRPGAPIEPRPFPERSGHEVDRRAQADMWRDDAERDGSGSVGQATSGTSDAVGTRRAPAAAPAARAIARGGTDPLRSSLGAVATPAGGGGDAADGIDAVDASGTTDSISSSSGPLVVRSDRAVAAGDAVAPPRWSAVASLADRGVVAHRAPSAQLAPARRGIPISLSDDRRPVTSIRRAVESGRREMVTTSPTGGDTTRKDLIHKDLTRADITHADITHADITHADLTRDDTAHDSTAGRSGALGETAAASVASLDRRTVGRSVGMFDEQIDASIDRAAERADADIVDDSPRSPRAPSGAPRPGTMFRALADRVDDDVPRRSRVVAPGPGALHAALTGTAERPVGAGEPPAVARDAAAQPREPTDDLADRFLSELSRRPQRAPQPLPGSFEPMAAAITGHHRVLMSTDDASRRALRSVGKVAATTDDVIHLARPPSGSMSGAAQRDTEIVAHELTHVAHPSPAPRFFDDDRRGAEERHADRVAAVMARSPLAPHASVSAARRHPSTTSPTSSTSTTSSAPAGPRGAPGAVRRTPAPASPGTIAAAALAADVTSNGASNGGSVVRRWASTRPQTASAGPAIGAHRGGPAAEPTIGTRRGSSTSVPSFDSREARDFFVEQLERNFDWILRTLEDRMIVELERRGGRYWGAL